MLSRTMNMLLLASIATVAVMADQSPNAAFEDSVRSFSVKVYKELASSSPGNFLVCPLSSELVLSLVLNGARGNTARQLADAISVPVNLSEVNRMVGAIVPQLHGEQNTYTLKSVNKIFVNHDTVIKPEFAKTANQIFKSTVGTVDFKKTQESLTQINDWTADNTEGRITNLLTTQDIKDDTRAILLNAIYFQATWSKRFNEQSTSQKSFHSSPDKTNTVAMMETTGSFQYFDHPDAQFLQMSYLGTDIAMIVALPKHTHGLGKLEDQIEHILRRQNFDYKKVHVLFPKFTMDMKIKMKPILQKLGVIDLFQSSADLTALSNENLLISEVVQKNYIEVNEKGTIAASATAAIAGLGSSYNPEEPIEFTADHPFIYYIASPAGIMFVGRYLGPE